MWKISAKQAMALLSPSERHKTEAQGKISTPGQRCIFPESDSASPMSLQPWWLRVLHMMQSASPRVHSGEKLGSTILRDSCQFILKGANVKIAPKHNFRASWRWDTLLWYFSSSLKRVWKEMSLATPIATRYLRAPFTWALVPLCHLVVYGLCTSTTRLCVQAPGNPKPLKMWSKAPKPQDFFPQHGNSPITLTRRTSLTISVWEWQLSTIHWYSTSFVGLSLNTAGSFESMSRLSKMLFAFKRW